MSVEATGSGRPDIPFVRSLRFITSSDGFVTVVVNQTTQLGRYPSQAEAEAAVKGLLTRFGSNTPDDRIASVYTESVDVTVDDLDDVSPTMNVPNTASHDYELNLPSTVVEAYPSAGVQITSLDRKIQLEVLKSNEDVALWYKYSDSAIAANTDEPEDDGYALLPARTKLIVEPNWYLRFKASASGTSNLSTVVTLYNLTNGSVADTFTINYTYTEIP